MKGGSKFDIRLVLCVVYVVLEVLYWRQLRVSAYSTKDVFGGQLHSSRCYRQKNRLCRSRMWLDDGGYGEGFLREWGTHIRLPPLPNFPSTFDSVCDGACDAISSTLYNRARPDPNVVSNAMSRSPLHFRPQISHNGGRLGVEIDGARHLLFTNDDGDDRHEESEAKALGRLALIMAGRLSQWPWKSMEDIENNETYPDNVYHQHSDDSRRSRPVTVYFTSISLALYATRELQHLIAREKQSSYFDNVRICCLGQDDIPIEMIPTKGSKQSRNKNFTVDPQRGLLLIVQPSSTYTNIPFSPRDSNNNVRIVPPIEALQRLLTRATIYQLPSVMLAPRFTSATRTTKSSRITTVTRDRYRFSTTTSADRSGGIDGSGYQQSEMYGGAEPTRPTPWLLRDYTPPVFAWVSTTNSLTRTNNRPRVGLIHSVMDEGHDWHIFVRESQRNYRYVASTKTSSGRPSLGIMEKVLNIGTTRKSSN